MGDFTFTEQLVLNLAGPLLTAIVVGFGAALWARHAQNRRDDQVRHQDQRREDQLREQDQRREAAQIQTEERAKQAQLQAKLVEEITEATETYFAQLTLIELRGKAADTSLDEALMEWKRASALVAAKLEVYLPDRPLLGNWERFSAAVWAAYFIFKNDEKEYRQERYNEFKKNYANFHRGPDHQLLVDVPLDDVGEKLPEYDLDLSMFLDGFRSQRMDLLDSLMVEEPVLSKRPRGNSAARTSDDMPELIRGGAPEGRELRRQSSDG